MGGYQSLLAVGNEFSSFDQVEAIAIQASVAVGSCPKILHQTHTSKKGGPCHISLICAQQEYHCKQNAFLNKSQNQNEKVLLTSICSGQINVVSTSTGSVKINSIKGYFEQFVGCITLQEYFSVKEEQAKTTINQNQATTNLNVPGSNDTSSQVSSLTMESSNMTSEKCKKNKEKVKLLLLIVHITDQQLVPKWYLQL